LLRRLKFWLRRELIGLGGRLLLRGLLWLDGRQIGESVAVHLQLKFLTGQKVGRFRFVAPKLT
jgi:hypothetical protein